MADYLPRNQGESAQDYESRVAQAKAGTLAAHMTVPDKEPPVTRNDIESNAQYEARVAAHHTQYGADKAAQDAAQKGKPTTPLGPTPSPTQPARVFGDTDEQHAARTESQIPKP